MIKKTKIFFLAIIVSGVIYLVGRIYFWDILRFVMNKPRGKKVEVSSSNSKDKVFLKSVSEGLNYKIRGISTSSSFDLNKNNDYVYTNDLDIFYQIDGDTLKVYTLILSEEPKNFNSDIIIEQIKLSNREYANLYDKVNELGLKFF